MSDKKEISNRKIKQLKSYKINNILEKLKIKGYKIIRNPEMEFSIPSTLWDGKIGSIAFCSKQRVKNPIQAINESKASVVITDKEVESKKLESKNKAVVLVENPREIFIRILNECFPPEKKKGEIHPSSEIDNEADIHPSVYIGPHCVIGKCKIGANSIIHPNVIINDNVTVGKNVIINPGSIIGYDGFGYNRNEKGHLEKFPHYGGVIIEDDVEIGSNVCIDRGTLGNTIIKKGAKIDNFCHISHNVIIGRHSAVIAHAMVGGSTIVGDYSWIAPSAALIDGIKVGNKALVGLGAVVTKDVQDNEVVVGNPAIPLERFKKIQKILKNLTKDREECRNK